MDKSIYKLLVCKVISGRVSEQQKSLAC